MGCLAVCFHVKSFKGKALVTNYSDTQQSDRNVFEPTTKSILLWTDAENCFWSKFFSPVWIENFWLILSIFSFEISISFYLRNRTKYSNRIIRLCCATFVSVFSTSWSTKPNLLNTLLFGKEFIIWSTWFGIYLDQRSH